MHLLKFHAVLYPHRQHVTVTASDVLKVADHIQAAYDTDYAVIRADKPVHTDKALIDVTVTFR